MKLSKMYEDKIYTNIDTLLVEMRKKAYKI